MEFQLRFTVADLGRDPANGESFLDGFMKVCPEGDPSISQNRDDGTLSVRFALEADDAKEAVLKGIDVFGRGVRETGLPATPVVDFEGSVVPDTSPDHGPQLQAA